MVDPLHDIIRSYGEDLRPSCSKYEMNKTTSLRFTYTPMHGVGAEAVKDAFKVFGLPDYIPVAEQVGSTCTVHLISPHCLKLGVFR